MKHVLEELLSYGPEESFYKIFEREAKHERVDNILVLCTEDILQQSHRDDSNNVIHVSRSEAGKIIILRFYLKNLHTQGSYSDDISFRFTSISFEEHETFRKHCDKTLAS